MGRTRDAAMSSHSWRRSILDSGPVPAEQPVLRYSTRAYQPDRAVDHDTLTTRKTPRRTTEGGPCEAIAEATFTCPLDTTELHISCGWRCRTRRTSTVARS